MTEHSAARQAKFRQAAFVYLHVGILYEAAVWVLHDAGRLPAGRGSVWLWLIVGAMIAGLVFWGLYRWQNAWLARAVWVLGTFRLPALLSGAFLPAPDAVLPAPFYGTALAVVLVNLWMLARAGWDL